MSGILEGAWFWSVSRSCNPIILLLQYGKKHYSIVMLLVFSMIVVLDDQIFINLILTYCIFLFLYLMTY